MSECKICGTDCQWTFCVDCQKLVKQGINAYEHQVADLTAKLKLAVEALETIDQAVVITWDIRAVVRNALKQIGEQR